MHNKFCMAPFLSGIKIVNTEYISISYDSYVNFYALIDLG